MKDQDYWKYHIQKLEEISSYTSLNEYSQKINFQGERGWECFQIRQNATPNSNRLFLTGNLK